MNIFDSKRHKRIFTSDFKCFFLKISFSFFSFGCTRFLVQEMMCSVDQKCFASSTFFVHEFWNWKVKTNQDVCFKFIFEKMRGNFYKPNEPKVQKLVKKIRHTFIFSQNSAWAASVLQIVAEFCGTASLKNRNCTFGFRNEINLKQALADIQFPPSTSTTFSTKKTNKQIFIWAGILCNYFLTVFVSTFLVFQAK